MGRRPTTAKAEPETVCPEPTAPFQIGLMEDRLGLLLRFAQAYVLKGLSEGFAPYELTPPQFSILVLIEANPGCRQANIGAALAVKQPNLVQHIDYLVARGLVSRMQDPSDRRANTLVMTAGGLKLLQEAKAVDEKVSQGFVDKLGAQDHAILIDMLKRLAPADRSPC